MTTYTGTWPLVRVALRRDRVIASAAATRSATVGYRLSVAAADA